MIQKTRYISAQLPPKKTQKSTPGFVEERPLAALNAVDLTSLKNGRTIFLSLVQKPDENRCMPRKTPLLKKTKAKTTLITDQQWNLM
uniref:Uncharacterized protein n=1 Tax=Tortanus forcipatus TaxID=197020 RepID=A0A0U2VAJ3_9MAXI|nr:hypothetical protein [Tortanus forcipatus]